MNWKYSFYSWLVLTNAALKVETTLHHYGNKNKELVSFTRHKNRSICCVYPDELPWRNVLNQYPVFIRTLCSLYWTFSPQLPRSLRQDTTTASTVILSFWVRLRRYKHCMLQIRASHWTNYQMIDCFIIQRERSIKGLLDVIHWRKQSKVTYTEVTYEIST